MGYQKTSFGAFGPHTPPTQCHTHLRRPARVGCSEEKGPGWMEGFTIWDGFFA